MAGINRFQNSKGFLWTEQSTDTAACESFRLTVRQWSPWISRQLPTFVVQFVLQSHSGLSCSSISVDYENDEHIHIIEHNRFPFGNNLQILAVTRWASSNHRAIECGKGRRSTRIEPRWSRPIQMRTAAAFASWWHQNCISLMQFYWCHQRGRSN